MVKYLWMGLLAFIVTVLPVNAEVVVKTQSGNDGIEKVSIENEHIRVVISSNAGKVVQFYDKNIGRNYTGTPDGLVHGFVKERDWISVNGELLTAIFDLKVKEKSDNHVIITAEYEATTSNFHGLLFRKEYELRTDEARLKVRQEVMSVKADQTFSLNVHNLVSLEGFAKENTYVFMPSKEKIVRFSILEGQRQGNSIVYDMTEPWIALIDQGSGQGVAFVPADTAELNNLYSWVGKDNCTMEWAYERKRLQPKAELDTWQTEYYVMPIAGMTSVHGADIDLLYACANNGNSLTVDLYPVIQLGEANLIISWNGNNILHERVDLRTAKPVRKEFSTEAMRGTGQLKIVVESAQKHIALTIPPAALKGKYASASNKIVKNVDEGIEGLYFYFDKLHISPDLTFPFTFGLRGDFRNKQDFRLVMEVPECVIIKSGRDNDKIKQTKYQDKGARYVRYEIPIRQRVSRFRTTTLFASCSISELPENATMGYYAKWSDGQQEKEIIPISIIRIDETPKLKKISVGLEMGGQWDGSAYPNIAENFKRAGLNFMAVGIDSWRLNTTETYRGKGAYLNTILPIEKQGIQTLTGNLGYPLIMPHNMWNKRYGVYENAGTLYYPNGEFMEGGVFEDFDIEDTKAVNTKGNRTDILCPSYRGRYYQKTLDNVRVLIDYGYSRLYYDEETWKGGLDICFCDRCKSRFRDYLNKNHPGVDYMDPITVANTPSRYNELNKAWTEFKFSLVQEIYDAMKAVAVEHGGKHIEFWAAVWGGADSEGKNPLGLTDYGRLAIPLDVLMPMVYTSDSHGAKIVGRAAEIVWRAAHKNARPGIFISPARTYEYERVRGRNYPPAKSVKHQFFEAVSGGAQVINIWSPDSALEGALSYKYIADAVRAIAPVEEIIVEGSQIKNLRVDNARVHARGMEYNGKAIIMVAEYSHSKLIAKVEYDTDRKCNVRDLETGMIVGTIAPTNNTFEIVLDEERARLFLVE